MVINPTRVILRLSEILSGYCSIAERPTLTVTPCLIIVEFGDGSFACLYLFEIY